MNSWMTDEVYLPLANLPTCVFGKNLTFLTAACDMV